MIRDETRRVLQPTAWLLLVGVMISVFVGLAAMLSNGWAAGANPATLVAIAAGSVAGPTFADRSAVASHVFTAIPVTAMAVAAVLLATHIGEKVRQARRITLVAVLAQSVALFLGVITWLVSLSVPHGAAKLAFLLDGAVAIMVATAGLFFSIVTLRSRDLQKPVVAARQASAYPGYGYGQQGSADAQGYPQPPGAQYPAAAGQQYGPPAAQRYGAAAAQQYGAAAQQYGAAAQQYGAASAQQYGQPQSPGHVAYGQQPSGSYGQQAYYPQSGYQQGYDTGYGQQQSYGPGHSSYAQPGPEAYQQAGPEAYQQAGPEAYQQAGPEAYQQAGPEAYQQAGPEAYQQAGPEAYQQPRPAPDDGESRDRR